MFKLLIIKKNPGILLSGVSKVWEDTYGCANKYICDLDIYWTNVLSSSYRIIMDRAINVPVIGNNVVDGINATGRRYLKE